MNFYEKDSNLYILDDDDKFKGASLAAIEETVTETKVVGLTITPKAQVFDTLENANILTEDEAIRKYQIDGDNGYTFPTTTVLIDAITDKSQSTETLEVTVVSNPAVGATIGASSGDGTVVTVSVTGNVITITRITNGTATITVTADVTGYTQGSTTFDVTTTDEIVVIEDVADVTLDSASDTVDVVTTPLDATVTASSDTESVVTVTVLDHTLTLTRVSDGTAIITVNGNSAGYEQGETTFGVTACGAT